MKQNKERDTLKDNFFYLIVLLCMTSCKTVDAILINRSNKDIVMVGRYNTLHGNAFHGHLANEVPRKGENCHVLFRDSILTLDEYFDIINSDKKNPRINTFSARNLYGSNTKFDFTLSDYYDILNKRGFIKQQSKVDFCKEQQPLYNENSYVSPECIDSIITVIIQPNGYIPIGVLINHKKVDKIQIIPFFTPLEITTPNETIKLNSFVFECPPQWKPTSIQEKNGMAVFLEYK